jgi:outer membrane protein OmpA-like peptidoglycan-associated protein
MKHRDHWIALALCAVSLCARSEDSRGQMLCRPVGYVEPLPASSERALLGFDAISASDIRIMRESVVTLPAEPPREIVELHDTLASTNFESGKADLLPAASGTLDALANKLSGKAALRLKVAGHTDNQRLAPRTRARFHDNQGLSEARAAAVAVYLRDKLKLATDRVGIEGRGELTPIADNGTPAGMARNRRVEITAWYEQRRVDAAAPQTAPAPARVEGSECGPDGAALNSDAPFRVTVDGVPLDEDRVRPEADRERCVDVALARNEVQIKYDPLNIAPALNVWLAQKTAVRGAPIEFGAYSNYVDWLRKAEIRVYAPEDYRAARPLAILPVEIGGNTVWTAPKDSPDALLYVLRVYDERGRFDETAAKPLQLLDHESGFQDADRPERERLTGWGENSRKLDNIPVKGGTVTVSGKLLADAESVRAMGALLPVDTQGKFATRQILSAGPHTVEVAVTGKDGATRRFRRNLSIADESWFILGLGDLTVGGGSTSGAPLAAIEELTKDDTHYRSKTYVDGRGAFYLRGRIKGNYLLKLAADTGEQPIEDLFSNFSAKDPRYLLRRIDPDRFYPVYGDDSTSVDDAPTQGKFYVRLERGDSHIMWGNFQTEWTGTELTQFSRGLYGANLLLKSAAITEQGEKKGVLNAFVAEPGTVAAREEFRATGGSLYYLRRQDLTEGSERVWVETRDKNSDFVLERRALAPAQDYDVNYLQGRILLRAPIASVADGAGLVQSATLNGNPVYVVVTYEYVPGLDKLDALSYGARGSQWIGEHLRLGASGFRQGDIGATQRLYGVDATLRYKPGTYLDLEAARSKGVGTNLDSSIDGGFQFASRGGGGDRADGRRVEGAADLAEIWQGYTGKLTGYWQDREAGYSAPGQIAANAEAVEQRGLGALLPLTAATRIELKADDRRADSQDYQAVEGALHHQINSRWAIALGARHDDRNLRSANASSFLSEAGARTDVVLRADYTPWGVYGYVQDTLSRSDERSQNDRYGLGGAWQATDRLQMSGELSSGDGGLGAKLGSDWRVNDRSNYYLNYSLETERPDTAVRGRQGDLTAGTHYRLSETTAIFGESRWRNGNGPESLTHAFGLDLAPTDRWTTNLKFETGRISDPLGGDLKRDAVGIAAAYKNALAKFSTAVEFRQDDGSGSKRRTWLMRNTAGYQTTPAWRLLGKFNFSMSQASSGNFFDGDYIEGVLGAAYRPIDNDRWNTLFKYTYFYDLPSPGQISRLGSGLDFSQRSHVLSFDAIYDLRPWVSVGVKYGSRIGELRDNRVGGEWFTSRADLIVGRADFHWVRAWDALIELRELKVHAAGDARFGTLLALYRHLGKHVKAGVGYNFTDFSDDLTDLSFRNHGWFFNILSTY